VVIDFSKMNQILSVNEADLTARVQPGVVLAEFQKHVSELGLFYPPDPASLEWCTIGGNVAENAGGPSAVKYGVTKDYVLGLRIVLPDGRDFYVGKQTIKGVTGFDLVALICGSEGTLAFVTEITLRLLAKPRHIQVALCRFSSRSGAILAATKLRKAMPQLRCLELMDSLSLKALRKLEGAAMRDFDADSLLFVEVDGSSKQELWDALVEVDTLLKHESYLGSLIAQDEAQRQQFWNLRRRLSAATKQWKKFKVSEDIVVPLSQMNAYMEKMDQLALEYSVEMCAFGHVGDGNLHVQIMFDDASKKERVSKLLEKLFRITIEHHGTLTGEHGIGIAKSDYLGLEQEAGLIDLQRQLKTVFDPHGLLNPGKFL